MKTTEIIQQSKDAILEKMIEVYKGEVKYNTDILIHENGDVTTNNYFGNVSYQDKTIIAILRITSQNKIEYRDYLQAELTESQLEYVRKNNFESIYLTKSESPEDWREFQTTTEDVVDEYETWFDCLNIEEDEFIPVPEETENNYYSPDVINNKYGW